MTLWLMAGAAMLLPMFWSSLPPYVAELSPTWANLVSTLALAILCATRLGQSGKSLDLRTELLIQPWLALGFFGLMLNIIAALDRLFG
ncbi:hypothetical protein AS149_13725 [Burkholderia cenocepacia]|nr:hypothetical protein AS149_13725 [Burkholderia cenocepacia]